MIQIKNLKAGADGREILKGINLEVRAGEVHAIMGPNGSGKSTLSSVIAGKSHYKISDGRIIYNGENLLAHTPEERAREGIFLAFQYPVEIPGLSTKVFLKNALNAKREFNGLKPMDSMDFDRFLKKKMKLLDIDEEFVERGLNVGFSGGEKKKNEILQMAVLEPDLAILDETDSGLDIDSLKVVSKGINKLRNKNNAIILVTHYQRILNYVKPDFVHVMYKGKIIKSGGAKLAKELEKKGYGEIKTASELISLK